MKNPMTVTINGIVHKNVKEITIMRNKETGDMEIDIFHPKDKVTSISIPSTSQVAVYGCDHRPMFSSSTLTTQQMTPNREVDLTGEPLK